MSAEDFSEERAFASDGESTYLLNKDWMVIMEGDENFDTSFYEHGAALLQRLTDNK